MTDRNMYFFLFNLEFPMWLPCALKMADAYKDWGQNVMCWTECVWWNEWRNHPDWWGGLSRLKEQFTPKWKFWHHLLTLVAFQTCRMTSVKILKSSRCCFPWNESGWRTFAFKLKKMNFHFFCVNCPFKMSNCAKLICKYWGILYCFMLNYNYISKITLFKMYTAQGKISSLKISNRYIL